ncbi:MAG: ROK family glucokinase [Acidimicrobiia bacterium]|nr:MAG: ROK family glucokinase [Acidimicrobiia bacterium]
MATIGIDIGGTNTRGVRFEGGAVGERSSGSVGDGGFVAAAADTARRLWTDDVEAVGVGLAGLVRWPEGSFAWGPHLGGEDIPVRKTLEGELGVPVVVDNDANVAAFGELRVGAAVGHDDFLMLTLGTGVGGGIVTGGAVYRGQSFAGEFGHMVYDTGGMLCDCGKRGCWETVASGPALVRLAREVIMLNPEGAFATRIGTGAFSGENVTAVADAGDEVARGLVAQVGSEFGRGLGSLIAIFDPELIVVGGGLGSVGEALLGPARRVAAEGLHGGNHRLLPPILVAGLGPDAGAIGAAVMATEGAR